MIWRKRGFSSAVFGNLDLEIDAVCVQCQENRCISQRLYALVHARKEMEILYDYCVEFSAVNTKSKRAVLSQCKDDRRCSHGLRRFNEFQIEHLGDFILFEPVHFWVELDTARNGLILCLQAIIRSDVGRLHPGPGWPSQMDSGFEFR